ncbi:MAG: hypothetical protein ABH950_05760 [Candidatus Altiarchaeota archaeon]
MKDPYIGRWDHGQAAMEFLLNYGWAIMVVLMVGVVLWDLGFFNISAEVYTMKGFAPIKPQLNTVTVNYLTDFYEFRGTFLNTLGTTIEITMADVNFPGGGCTNVWVEYGDFNQPMNWGSSVLVPKGEHFGIWGEACAPGSPKEENLNVNIAITYDAKIGGDSTTRTATGIIKGPVHEP